MSKVPEKLAKAKRVNQAYQTYYGPQMIVTNAFTRDMPADAVITRRSWFPTLATSEWFSGPVYNAKARNIKITKGKDVKNLDRAQMRTAMPGSLAKTTQLNVPTLRLDADDSVQGHTLLYILIIVLGLVLLSLFI